MKSMKNLLAGAALLAAIAAPAMAQETLQKTEWTTYDAWGNQHKTVYTELRQHPDWAYDTTYIGKHPELKAYYDEHPAYYTYVKKHHDWNRHHPGWEKTTTTTTTVEH